jgi:anaerobic dimethyl sulfoxide reductase subunit C
MNDNFTSLVFFTVLCQTAVGALIFRWLILLKQGIDDTPFEFRKVSLVVISLLLIISLAIAFLHLGKPAHAFYAVNNLGKSWLSREIFFLSLLIATILFTLIVITKNSYGKKEMITSVVGVLAGLSLIYSMIRLYMIPSVITWYNPFTPISFIITTSLCGILLLVIISGKHNNNILSAAPPAVAVFILLSIINSFLFNGSFLRQCHVLLIIRTVLSVLSMIIITVIYFRSDSNNIITLWVILFITVVSSEIINRYIFFLSFEKFGL